MLVKEIREKSKEAAKNQKLKDQKIDEAFKSEHLKEKLEQRQEEVKNG